MKYNLVQTPFRSTLLNDSTFDNLFDNFLNLTHNSKSNYMTVPRANVIKNEHGYSIELAAPGFTRDEFQLSVDNGTLTVKVGTEDSEGYEQRVVSREYMFESFTRNWTLPENANSDSISARYEAGILLIDVPVKNERHAARLISVD